jgi:hypothetical protein
VGALIGAAAFIGVAAMGAPELVVAGVYIGAQIVSFAASVIGAVKGWKAASKAQAEYSTQAPALSYQQSRGQDVGMSGPQRSSEISDNPERRNNWAASVDAERAAQATAVVQR